MIIANRDQQTLEEANAKVREAEERRVALDDALRALDQKIAETTKRLEEAKDKAERDRVAQVLEQEADAVEKASLAVDKAAKQFASCVSATAIGDVACQLLAHPGDAASSGGQSSRFARGRGAGWRGTRPVRS